MTTVHAPRTVWLASYPRSGSTWTRAVLAALTGPAPASHRHPCRRLDVHGLDDPVDINALPTGPIASARAVIDSVLGFASSDLLPAEIEALRPACDATVDARLSRVTVRKIHDAFGGVAHPAVAIYLVRDPRDVAVSLAAFHGRTHAWAVERMANPAAALGDSATELGNQVRQRLGRWGTHVDGWTGHGLFPVEVFRYEDLHVDPVGRFGRLAGLAGLDAGPADVAAAVAAARFDRLRRQEERDGFRERPAADRRFFRRGVVGGWRDELAPDLVRRIESDHRSTMDRFGYPRAY